MVYDDRGGLAQLTGNDNILSARTGITHNLNADKALERLADPLLQLYIFNNNIGSNTEDAGSQFC